MPNLTATTPPTFTARGLTRLGMLLSLCLAVSVSYTAAAARPNAEAAAALVILLRTSDGVPVAGIRIMLRSAPVTLGGSATPLPTQEATTDAMGHSRFHDLGHWVWYATFSGTFDGQSLQPPQAQGKPPWGTNPAGDGFPLVVDPQLENEGNLPTTTDEAPIVTYPFVLTLDRMTWVPELDLAGAAASPVPLAALSGTPALVVPLPVAAPIQAAPSRFDLSGLLLFLAVGGAGVVALYQSWRQRTHRHAIARRPADPPTAEGRNNLPPHFPGD